MNSWQNTSLVRAVALALVSCALFGCDSDGVTPVCPDGSGACVTPPGDASTIVTTTDDAASSASNDAATSADTTDANTAETGLASDGGVKSDAAPPSDGSLLDVKLDLLDAKVD